MSNIFIDPYVFACPSPQEGLTAFRNYVHTILAWKDLKDTGWDSLYTTARTHYVLTTTNSWPLWDTLKQSITTLNINDIQPKDIIDLVTSLLTKLPTLEDTFLIEEILVDEVTYEPSYHIDARHRSFAEEYARLCILLCLISRLPSVDNQIQLLITRRLNTDHLASSVTGTVLDYECCNSIALPKCPINIEGKIILCNTPHGLFLSVDPSLLWIRANCAEGYMTAIKIFAYKIGHESGVAVALDDLHWTFNPQFLESAQKLGFLHEPKKIKMLLKACAETILNINMRDTHALRTGSGPAEPQMLRANDKAWRRDIDYEYHLHYWETSNGPEFAAVVTHNDMRIPS